MFSKFVFVLLTNAVQVSSDSSQWKIPQGDSIIRKLENGQSVFDGKHWTEFSSPYGACVDPDIEDSADPEKRYNFNYPEKNCILEKCINPMREGQRYKVCTHPDHPSVKDRISPNFMTKLKENRDGKMYRLDKFIDSSTDDYDQWYTHTLAKSFATFKPARGWPSMITGDSCTDAVKEYFKKKATDHDIESWNDLKFTETTGKSYCEYDGDLGLFVDCYNGKYHSENIRCDPRISLLAKEIVDANKALKLTEADVLDRLEYAHYQEGGKLNGVEITGKQNSNALVRQPYAVSKVNIVTCPSNCPIPYPWTPWSCSCGNNSGSMPRCCNAKRRRYRGCKDASCDDDITCGSNAKVLDMDHDLAANCNSYIADKTCPKRTELYSNNWWKDNWMRPADIRNTKDTMTEDRAVSIIKSTWMDRNVLTTYDITVDELDIFMKKYPAVNLMDMTYFKVDSCLNSMDPDNFTDNFGKCLVTDAANNRIDTLKRSNSIRHFISELPFPPDVTANGVVNWEKAFPDISELRSLGSDDAAFAKVVHSRVHKLTTGSTFTLNEATTMVAKVLKCLPNDLVHLTLIGEANYDRSVKTFKRFRDGPWFDINVTGHIDLDAYANDEFYKANMQNIYAQDYKNGGLGRDTSQGSLTPLSNPEYVGNIVASGTTCNTAYEESYAHTQCLIEETPGKQSVGYTQDNKRLEWKIEDGKVSLPTYDGNRCAQAVCDDDSSTSSHPCFSLPQAVINWFEALHCRPEMAKQEEVCPPAPLIGTVTDNECVTGYQGGTPSQPTGFRRGSLIVNILNWGVSGTTVDLRIFYSPSGWGKPHKDNYHPDDFDLNTMLPTNEYLGRYANFDVSKLCDDIPDPIPCRLCQYTAWSEWGSWNVHQNTYYGDDEDVGDEKSAADGFQNSYLSTRNSWLAPRDDYGDAPSERQMCFRIFETKESFQNIASILDKILTKAKTLAKDNTLVKSDNKFKFYLLLIKSWLTDGLFIDRSDAQTGISVSELNAVLGSDVAGFKAAVAKLDISKFDLINVGNKYNFDLNRYEYIGGIKTNNGNNTLLGSEGWHLDVLKKWLDGTGDLKPHGWRFSCRDRDDNIQGYKARYRDSQYQNQDCCGLVDIVKCDLPVCPDWTEWIPWSDCSKSCIEENTDANYGFKARGRSCEAHTGLMDSDSLPNHVPIQLPEKLYTGCTCATEIDAEAVYETVCQSEAVIAYTKDFCSFQLATCNYNKPCPKQSAYKIIKDCPNCGAGTKVKQLLCEGPDLKLDSKNDWETRAAYDASDCKFDKPEYVSEMCPGNQCTSSTTTACINGYKTIVKNGAIETVACDDEYSEWSFCPESCFGRLQQESFRWQSTGEVETILCPQSTNQCPTWTRWSQWSSCINTKMTRSRTCFNPNNVEKLGSECVGDERQQCGCA